MAEEKKLTIREATENRIALIGRQADPQTGNRGLVGIASMDVPAGKTNMNIAINVQGLKQFGEVYDAQITGFTKEHCKVNEKGFQTNEFKSSKDAEDYIAKVKAFNNEEYPGKMLRLNMKVLNQIQGITPEHISLLLPIIDGEQTGD